MNAQTKIKICGLFRPKDIEFVNQLQPDFAGFILAPGFRRSITRKTAALFRQAMDAAIPAVGVFVNASCEEILSCLREDIIQMAQLHGNETEEEIQYIKAVSGKAVTKAVKVQSRADVEAWLDTAADYLVFDAGAGSGTVFNWDYLKGINRQYFLAGGLNAGNLEQALRLHPYAVDISSGVERDGVKDRAKMQAMIDMVRNYSIS